MVKSVANTIKDSNVDKPTTTKEEENILPINKRKVSDPNFNISDSCLERAPTSPNINANAEPEQGITNMDQSKQDTTVDLAHPPPTNNARDVSIANNHCNKKACDAEWYNEYVYGGKVGHENGLASGYKFSYSNRYNHAVAHTPDSNDSQDSTNNCNSDNTDKKYNDHGYIKW